MNEFEKQEIILNVDDRHKEYISDALALRKKVWNKLVWQYNKNDQLECDFKVGQDICKDIYKQNRQFNTVAAGIIDATIKDYLATFDTLLLGDQGKPKEREEMSSFRLSKKEEYELNKTSLLMAHLNMDDKGVGPITFESEYVLSNDIDSIFIEKSGDTFKLTVVIAWNM